MRLARLLCVTDSRADSADLASFAAGVFGAGVNVLQLRDDRASDTDKLAALELLRTAAFPHGLVSVYADLELAREFAADVLHLPKGRPEATKARRYVSRWASVGRSCYSESEIDAALADDGIDFLTIGPAFGGLPWFGRLPGLDLVRHAAQVADPSVQGTKPWFAIGGITLDNLDEVLAAGARRVAIGRAITSATDPAAAARAFGDRLRAAWGDEFDAFILDAAAAEGRFRPVADPDEFDSDRPRLEQDPEFPQNP